MEVRDEVSGEATNLETILVEDQKQITVISGL
jgi:hypothetical protein